jgi:hypothetical protein
VDAALHRIEALPGAGRYAVTFRDRSGAEHAAVAQVTGATVELPAARLPADWEPGGAAYPHLVAALVAIDTARRSAQAPAELIDVPGGWDVMIGTVLLTDGIVTCAAHSAMRLTDSGEWVCPECGARAIFARA